MSHSLPTEPGQWVVHPDRPDWGPGQVQSIVGDRITVNFENAGKVLVNGRIVALQVMDARSGREQGWKS